jgi:hypothetical protein
MSCFHVSAATCVCRQERDKVMAESTRSSTRKVSNRKPNINEANTSKTGSSAMDVAMSDR